MTEFVPLMALMISLIALSIDAMLPALPNIGSDLGAGTVNDQQLIVTSLLLGMGLAQMVYGPLSDTIGRKRAIYSGYVIFVIGCALSIWSTSFEMMLTGRVLQGVGAAGPRIICIALVRDQYEGREMARIMSFVMGVFILVPALAPVVGQGIIMLSHWRAIFVLFLVLSITAWIWFAVRQPETLLPEKRVPFTLSIIWSGVKETCGNRVSFGYTMVAGTIFGAFVGYLSSAQQMFDVIYGITEMFPLYFAVLALSIGTSSFINARLVMRFGMRLLSSHALRCLTAMSVAYFAYAFFVDMTPALELNMAYFVAAFLCTGILFGNVSAIAMEPLGHIAGVGAAVVGSLSTLLSVMLGGLIGQAFDGTVLPLVGGFTVLGLLAMAIMHWAELGNVRDHSADGHV
ncbi:MAG: multidrug effflux MFS transporter [Rhodospirillales bacterium]|jgi:MFS transporter, DHA1 family, multidrug resistance protein|nr:multidrug effflux MFS transporter [Rhodospirillales bacterium]MBT5351883.1 multidrug effflux MFS transporter [Rhodospirillales bacterium]MBT5520629.1 multidrug effflux MFS transporter [Rhodospirillales bacterium]MBT6111723.1 multidrug effflux MFS transporter [Rhodospirillales bacterium]MBT6827857.1 multidrug effflux MFS transporter [Rhodospirillales bacterium]